MARLSAVDTPEKQDYYEELEFFDELFEEQSSTHISLEIASDIRQEFTIVVI